MNQFSDLASEFGEIEVKLNEPLAKYTTWKVGGPADLFIVTKNSSELKDVINTAKTFHIPYTILGWGSNVLISDEGIRGLVIRNESKDYRVIKEPFTDSFQPEFTGKQFARLEQLDKTKYSDFDSLVYEEDGEKILVRIDSGIYLPFAINILITNGITGLQWFAGIPGTLGGGIYNNIHGGGYFMSDFVYSVEVLSNSSKVETLSYKQLAFGYDYSSFHKNNNVILTADLILFRGDKTKARESSIAWAKAKSIQPHNSAGCCYQNLDKETQARLKLDSNSWGYIIDKVLALKGTQRGNAEISPKHAAFIENKGGASANDIYQLLKLVSDTAKNKLGVRPKLEVFLLGFSDKQKQSLEN